MSLQYEPSSEPLHIRVSKTPLRVPKTAPSFFNTPPRGTLHEAQRDAAERDVMRFAEAVMHQVVTIFLWGGGSEQRERC